VCRGTGRPVVEVEGWQTRARGSGGYNPGKPDHVIVHHTASGPSSDGWPDVNYTTFAHPDAPLCNLYLARDGTIYVCAGGATNTNGSGDCDHLEPDTANSSSIGIEAGNDGVGEAWPVAQQTAYTALCGVLCDAYGIPVTHVHGHAEWAPSRKIDPAGPSDYAIGSATWDMDAFRADIGIDVPPVPVPTPEPTPNPPEVDDMPKPFLVTLARDGAWYCTDLATYKTYVGNPGAASDALGPLGAWQGAGDGPWVLGDQWAEFIDALPQT
jgi:hypothetical protein